MRIKPPAQAFLAGVLLLAAACSEQEAPTGPSTRPESPIVQLPAQGSADDPVSLARGVRGFGGFYLDTQGTPVVYLRNGTERINAERALAPFLSSQGLSPSQLRVLPARYEWAQLEAWSSKASAGALAIPGAVFVDADEGSNRVTIGVERGAQSRIRGIVARLGIPADAVVLQETEPIRLAATLRSKVRPVS